MFESLKKKFSKTSEKLEEELIEEAQAEDNLQEESGSRFSFFSFGKKDKADEESEDENLLPESVEAEEVGDEPASDEKEEKSHFWSRNKDKDNDEDDSEEEKSRFWSRSKKDSEDISADGEAKGGIFSFVREKTIQEKHVEDILFELEMELLQADVAMEVATEVVESVKENLVGKKIKRSNDITEYTFYALRDAVEEIISIPGKSMTEMIEEKKAQGEPLVVMFVGINGTGKTTTIGKLANYYLKKGYPLDFLHLIHKICICLHS